MYLGSSITVAGEVPTPPLLPMTSLSPIFTAKLLPYVWTNDLMRTMLVHNDQCVLDVHSRSWLHTHRHRHRQEQLLHNYGILNNLNQQLRVAQGVTQRSYPRICSPLRRCLAWPPGSRGWCWWFQWGDDRCSPLVPGSPPVAEHYHPLGLQGKKGSDWTIVGDVCT